MDGKFVRRIILAGTLTMLYSGLPVDAQSVAVGMQPEHASTTATVTVNVTKVKLEHALRLIAQQVGLKFFTSDVIDVQSKLVTLHLRDVPASDAFAQALAGTGLKATIGAGIVVFSPAPSAPTLVVQGGITGKVVDAKTKSPLRGAMVTVDNAATGVISADDGTFRFANIASGTRTLRVRFLGYVKASRSVTIIDGQTVSVEIVLEQSVNALDQIVVTGTVVSTEMRAVPNAMTVITAKDLEERGIVRIDQLFRGDVPGVFSMNLGSTSPLDQVVMFSRGATALSATSVGTGGWNTNAIKTYVDGVELADPTYLSQLDPKSIERIEIITGPQASTIYGSNSINGVMQIFTKRGTSSRPQLTTTLLSGWVENNFRPTRTPQHDDAVQVTGVEGHWAYSTGGSWNYLGPWTPGKQTSRMSSFGGARMQRGPMTADWSLRLATTRNRQGGAANQTANAFREQGWYRPDGTNGFNVPTTQTLRGQTLGLSLGFVPVSWWSHELVLGTDRSDTEQRTTALGFRRPNDSLVAFSQGTSYRRSLRYTSTVQVPLAQAARAVVTVGADAWQSLNSSLEMSAFALTGTLPPSGTPTVTRQPGHDAGGFLQAQVGLWDQLFVTYGLRAEWNPTYGDEAQPNWAPRYGMSFVRDFGTPIGIVTAKLRGSYGRSTRPPAVGAKKAVSVTAYNGASFANSFYIPYYGEFDQFLANSELGPEYQQGGEGGLEFYLGNRGSMMVTWYNQTVDGLIAQPTVDSVRSKDPTNMPPVYNSCDAVGYCYTGQLRSLNVGAIRNLGWELQGTMVTGPLTTGGTYSWTKSRTIGVDPRYREFFSPIGWPQYQPGATFQFLPEHMWSVKVTYTHARSTIALNLSGTGQLANTANKRSITRYGGVIRLTGDRWRMESGNDTKMNAGYVVADLNASQRLFPCLDGVLQVQNLGDVYHNDEGGAYASLGRQTKLGFRLRM